MYAAGALPALGGLLLAPGEVALGALVGGWLTAHPRA